MIDIRTFIDELFGSIVIGEGRFKEPFGRAITDDYRLAWLYERFRRALQSLECVYSLHELLPNIFMFESTTVDELLFKPLLTPNLFFFPLLVGEEESFKLILTTASTFSEGLSIIACFTSCTKPSGFCLMRYR